MNESIKADQHPWCKYHTGTTGGYRFFFENSQLDHIDYESYCGHSGGGTVWIKGDDPKKALGKIKASTFSDTKENKFMKKIAADLAT